MPSVWEAANDIKQLVRELKEAHHPHLGQASIWCLCSDGKAVRDNRVITTVSRKCTKTEKLSSGHDFKITLMMESWAQLTDEQRRIAIDEALCRCGVKFLPETVEINGKKEVVKDDLGRTVYTDEISYEEDGTPRWKINKPDAEVFYPMLQRHRLYTEDVENIQRTLDGKPIKSPQSATPRADLITEEMATFG